MEVEKPYKIIHVHSGTYGVWYSVSHYETFSECICPGFKYRNTCKHLKITK